jgi:hypothetical protein
MTRGNDVMTLLTGRPFLVRQDKGRRAKIIEKEGGGGNRRKDKVGGGEKSAVYSSAVAPAIIHSDVY